MTWYIFVLPDLPALTLLQPHFVLSVNSGGGQRKYKQPLRQGFPVYHAPLQLTERASASSYKLVRKPPLCRRYQCISLHSMQQLQASWTTQPCFCIQFMINIKSGGVLEMRLNSKESVGLLKRGLPRTDKKNTASLA